MTTETLSELLAKHNVTAQWTFSTYFRGVHAQSPRVFDSVETALHAIVEKLAMHAQDAEYPMISLVMLNCRYAP